MATVWGSLGLWGAETPAGWYQGGPWEKGLFSDDLAAYRKAADANKPPTQLSVTVFFNGSKVDYQPDGSVVSRSSLVYRIETQDGIKNWSNFEVTYSPWHEDAPKLKVRILNPDGQVILLTEKDLLEVSSGSSDSQIYQDAKTLKVPYPNVTVGSLIEEELTSGTHPYMAGSGVASYWSFVKGYAVGLNRYSLSFGAGSPVRYKTSFGATPAPAKTDSAGTTSLVWEFRNTVAAPAQEDNAPPELRQRSSIAVTSAPGWEQLAQGYGDAVEKVLARDPLALPAELVQKVRNPDVAVLADSAWINDRVRYTGLELGQNSIFPFSPKEVLARGYGDCKDKATLLVALLRAQGYKAWVSLIDTGPGWDVDPELPDMMDFNHAIVYVGEGDGFWFDPTVDVNRKTTLPYYDQYRYTLIARPGQKEISRTPLALARDNVITENRDVVMKDEGRGNVEEVTIYSGAYDSYYRNRHLFLDAKKANDQLVTYANDYYDTKKVPKAFWYDPLDFSKSYGMTISSEGVSQASTGDTDAEASFHLNNLWSELPSALLDEKDPPRTQPFRFGIPFVYQMNVTVHPPAGFQVRDIPDDVSVDRAGFSFRRQWLVKKDGSLLARVSFELKQFQYTTDEYKVLHEDLKKLHADQNLQSLQFDHQAEALRAEGQYAEAFSIYRKLLESDPGSAIQNKRLSVALQSYSLGQPAVFYAKRAVELQPDNAGLWANLALMLMNDGLGRRLNKGYDRAGALAAWQKAIALDPDTKSHQANLGILYEYNESGERFQDAGDLVRARDVYLGLGTSLKSFALVTNLWNIQIRLGDFAAAKALLPDIADEAQRNVARAVTDIMAGNHTPAAKLLEPNLTLEKRQSYWVGAADSLVALRRYADAATLLRQAAIANKDAASLENRADTLAKINAKDSSGDTTATPVGTVRNFLFDYLRQTVPVQQIFTKYFSRTFLANLADLGLDNEAEHLESAILPVIGDGTPRLLTDFALSVLHFDTVGDDARGYKVSAGFDGGQGYQFFLLKEGNEFKILTWSSELGLVGRQIVADLAAGKNDRALLLFNWVFTPTKMQNADPLTVTYFSDDKLVRSPWLMRLVAQELALVENPRKMVEAGFDALWPVLQNRAAFVTEAVANGVGADNAPGLWTALAFNLADIAVGNRAYDRAEKVAEVLAPGFVGDSRFVPWFARCQALSGHEQEAEALMEAYRDTKVDDVKVFGQLLNVYQINMDFAKMDAETAQYPSRLSAYDLNNLAWDELFRNPGQAPLPVALERARKSVALKADHANLHTLATIYATLGRYDEARSVLAKAIDMNSGQEPTSDDWYVIGLIADGYGFHEAAREAWLKVTPRDTELRHRIDTNVLAQLRLGS